MASSPSRASEDARRQTEQCLGLVVGVCLGVSVALCLVPGVLTRSDRPSVHLESRINPNTASVGSLIRLPGIGLTRAQAIIAYRDGFSELWSDEAAFKSPGDLQQIRGIGPKTVEGLAPWVRLDRLPDGTREVPRNETFPE